MLIPDYTVDDLKHLPLRAIAVFAVRCARRVEHLATGDQHAGEKLSPAVAAAIQMVEDFARGLPFTKCASVLAKIEVGRHAARDELVQERALTTVIWTTHMMATAQRCA